MAPAFRAPRVSSYLARCTRIVEHRECEINERRLRRLAGAGPVAACDEEERAFQAARLEDSLHLLAERAAYVVDAAAVERAHDGGPGQGEARAIVGLDGLAQPDIREVH